MDKMKMQRINELSKKAKTVGLSDEEKAEQISLRKEYISAFKKDLESTLESVIIVDKNGNKSPLKKK